MAVPSRIFAVRLGLPRKNSNGNFHIPERFQRHNYKV